MGEREDEIIRSGIMKKRGTRMWGERYFVLKGPILYYYLKKTDTEAKGTLQLNGACKITSLRSDPKRKQFIFEISWPVIDNEPDDKSVNGQNTDMQGKSDPVKKRIGFMKRDEKKPNGTDTTGRNTNAAAIAAGGVVAGSMTSGVGLFASMFYQGATSNNNHNPHHNNGTTYNFHKQIVLSCESSRDAELWIEAISEQIRELSDNILGIPFVSNPGLSVESTRNEPPPELRLDEVEEWIKSSKWRVYDVYEGVRIFEQSFNDDADPVRTNDASSEPPCLRVNVCINGSANDAYSAIMTLPPSCRTGTVKSLRVVSTIDNNTDIIHMALDQVYLYPSWTAPRDFCLTRYWKQNLDGSYVICLDSTFHRDCPLVTGYVRGDLHAAYYIAPVKDEIDDEQQSECLLTMIAQVQPKGWIPKQYGYQHRFLQQLLLHVLDIRDAVDNERFVQLNFDSTIAEKRRVSVSHDSKASANPSNGDSSQSVTIGTIIPPTVLANQWGESDASTFRVRGPTYLQDKVKTASLPSLFKLEAIDVYETPESAHNIAANPRNRVSLAQQRGEKLWTLVFNIMIPGPPYYSFVVYFSGDKALINEDTPFGRVARPFFYGNDDEFRNNRFKLVPKIVDGNFVIKMAVKDTPTLLGNKLKQYYYKDDHYFEIDVDVGSSSVARNIVGLAIGYSKNIVVDLGLCLQGNDESELPEVMMGVASCIHVDMGSAKKL